MSYGNQETNEKDIRRIGGINVWKISSGGKQLERSIKEFKICKKQCWKIYEVIRRIKGKQPRQIAILHADGEYFNTTNQISEKL